MSVHDLMSFVEKFHFHALSSFAIEQMPRESVALIFLYVHNVRIYMDNNINVNTFY